MVVFFLLFIDFSTRIIPNLIATGVKAADLPIELFEEVLGDTNHKARPIPHSTMTRVTTWRA